DRASRSTAAIVARFQRHFDRLAAHKNWLGDLLKLILKICHVMGVPKLGQLLLKYGRIPLRSIASATYGTYYRGFGIADTDVKHPPRAGPALQTGISSSR